MRTWPEQENHILASENAHIGTNFNDYKNLKANFIGYENHHTTHLPPKSLLLYSSKAWSQTNKKRMPSIPFPISTDDLLHQLSSTFHINHRSTQVVTKSTNKKSQAIQ